MEVHAFFGIAPDTSFSIVNKLQAHFSDFRAA